MGAVLLTPELLTKIRIAMPEEPEIQIEDQDCDAYDRARVVESFAELKTSLVTRGFTLVEQDQADLQLRHATRVTSCTYDGMVHGRSDLELRDRSGQTVELVTLFPLWPDGLADQLLRSPRLLRYAQTSKKDSEPEKPPPQRETLISAPELDPHLVIKLTEYWTLRLSERGMPARQMPKAKVIRFGSQCALVAQPDGEPPVMHRSDCSPEELLATIDRVVTQLVAPPEGKSPPIPPL